MADRGSKIFVEEFDEWRTGDTFGIGLEDVKTVPKGSYQAFNMQVYTNGTLGVRPWLRNHGAVVGTSAFGTKPATVFAIEEVSRDQNNEDITASWILAQTNIGAAYIKVAGTASGSWTTTDSITDHAGSAASGRLNPHNNMSVLDIHETETVVGGHRVINVVGASGVDLSHAPSFDPDRAAAYKSRMYVWGDVSDPYRIHFSDNTGYSNLTAATNFFDLGVSGTSGGIRVEGLYATSDALILYRSDGIWHALTGASPESGVVREIGPNRIPEWYKSVAVYKNQLMFLGTEGVGLTIMSPGGADLRLDVVRPREILRNQTGSGQEKIEPREAIVSYLYNSAHFTFIRYNADSNSQWAEGFKSIDYVNESFNMSGYWMLAEGSGSGFYADDSAEDIYGITMVGDRLITIVAEPLRFLSTVPVVYTRDVTLDRPSRLDDPFSGRIEDDDDVSSLHYAAGQVRLRKQGLKDGHRVRVRRVIVDARYWKDASNTNWVPADMGCTDTDGNTLIRDSTWSQAALANTDYAGAPTRLVFTNDATEFSNEVGVSLIGINTMAVVNVTVEYEMQRFVNR